MGWEKDREEDQLGAVLATCPSTAETQRLFRVASRKTAENCRVGDERGCQVQKVQGCFSVMKMEAGHHGHFVSEVTGRGICVP